MLLVCLKNVDVRELNKFNFDKNRKRLRAHAKTNKSG